MRRHLAPAVSLWTVALLAAVALPALAGPIVLPAQGVLRTATGGAAPDGTYPLTFQLYESEKTTDPLWKEIHIAVAIQFGAFQVELGTQDKFQPLNSDLVTTHDELWLSVKVGADPELPRVRLSRVPYAIRALVADKLTGKLDGSQIASGTVPGSAVGFGYAGSDDKGGAAVGLKCTGCVDKGHLAPGLLDAQNIAMQVGQKASTVQAELGAMVTTIKVQGGQVGLSKFPANACALDVGTDAGDTCIDGVPALWTRHANSEKVMNGFAKEGQMVYRTDVKRVFVNASGKWRELMWKAVCGDGEIDTPEQCDAGLKNADAADQCRTTCLKPACGDKIQDTGESCDDGNPIDTDACAGCKKAICGDGFLYAGVEDCDAGAANSDKADACRTSCKKPKCGDKITDTGEGCDDGNGDEGDGCASSCKLTCGDGVCATFETNKTCDKDCPKPLLWLESDQVRWFPIKYPHADYKESKAVATCKAAGLRLWRDENGNANDPDYVYDLNDFHNLGGHDIGAKVSSAVSNQQEGHTGIWKAFGQTWSDSIKATAGVGNGTSVHVLNKKHHTVTYENDCDYTIIRPQSGSVELVQGNQTGTLSGLTNAIVLCSERK